MTLQLDGIFTPTTPGSDITRAVTLSQATRTPLIVSNSPRVPDAGPEIARKRNEAMQTATSRGWQRIMLLDDDITVEPEAVLAALKLLPAYPAAGFRLTEFPDHSTVIHAHLAAGGTSPVCITGGALLLDMTYPHKPFPPVYNDDQLFLHPLLETGGIADAGEARQLPYDPFTAERARTQEFGDILNDGLTRLRQAGQTVTKADEGFWVQQLTLRRALIHDILTRLTLTPATNAAQISLTELDTITPARLTQFITRWLVP